MKHQLLALTVALTATTAFAGDPYVEPAPMPPPQSLWSWFVGGTAGYLTDNEEGMYTGHVGVDLPWQLGGFSQALYLEVGYAEINTDFHLNVYYDDYPGDLSAPPGFGKFERIKVRSEVQVIPVSLNYKLERPLTSALNVYFGAGAGVAFVEAKLKARGESEDDDDTVFYGQLFAGLLYNVTPNFELFAGARYIYLDDPNFSIDGVSFDLDDLDVNNDDALIEVGGRFNF